MHLTMLLFSRYLQLYLVALPTASPRPSRMKRIEVPAKTAILKQGQESSQVYLLVDGQVDIQVAAPP